jgi:hypothetical protein
MKRVRRNHDVILDADLQQEISKRDELKKEVGGEGWEESLKEQEEKVRGMVKAKKREL